MEAPRDELLTFAVIMEQRLRANDHKTGWANLTNQWLLMRVRQELKELERALKDRSNVHDEAADAANFLMMISDNYAEEQSNAGNQGQTPQGENHE